MAIVNEQTGYFGFTVDGLDGTIDENGCIDRVIFAINYPLRSKEVDFTISDTPGDFGAQMGDGTIIPLSNPRIIFQNRDNTIVEFTMDRKYPTNSPCNLVYRSDTAWWKVEEWKTEDRRPFEPNTFSGWFGCTIDGYEGTSDPKSGHVNRVIFPVPFPAQNVRITFTITDDPSHWGARMPNGEIITLRNPTVVSTNADNAVVVFEMDKTYPSNSPCLLVYRSAEARVNISVEFEEIFIPVDDIDNIPSEINVGETFDLNYAAVKPMNASIQTITWKLNSGYANLSTDNRLTPTAAGTIILTATIVGGRGDMVNFSKSFTIKANAANVRITRQPESYIPVHYGSISGLIDLTASVVFGTLTYQWYTSTTGSNVNGTPITGETHSFMNIPTTLPPGDHYYYCIVGASGGATSARSNVVHVHVAVAATSITINPKPVSIPATTQRQLSASIYPSNADDQTIIWSVSNPAVASIDTSGLLSALAEGSVTVTARTSDGLVYDSCTIAVVPFVKVTRIVGVPVRAIVGQALTLANALVEPDNASSKNITWSIVNDFGTDAILEKDSLLIPLTTGEYECCIIRASIADGIAGGVNFEQDFRVIVEYPFTPVSGIAIAKNYAKAEEELVINAVCVPYNATRQTIIWTIDSDGDTGAAYDGARNVLTATHPGVVRMAARVVNGASDNRDFLQIIPITITDKQIPVSSIDDVVTEVEVGELTPLGGSVKPIDATYQEIVWSIPEDANNRIGATITEDGNFRANRTGSVEVLATIAKGQFEGSDDVVYDNSVDYTQRFTIKVINFVKVSDITGIPTKAAAGSTVTLNGTIVPDNASKTSITWSLVSAGSTGATISGRKLTVKSRGTVRVKATIKDGKGIGWSMGGSGSNDFTKTFDIVVGDPITAVEDITGIPESISIGEYEFHATVTPPDATSTEIEWSIEDAGTTDAIIIENSLITEHPGTVIVRASIADGVNYDVPYTEDFTIEILDIDASSEG